MTSDSLANQLASRIQKHENSMEHRKRTNRNNNTRKPTGSYIKYKIKYKNTNEENLKIISQYSHTISRESSIENNKYTRNIKK
mmetsp:Transcript_5706/g.7558  ORF Transcript_5706/g.7558 Transcript_5706/m.7558 type:complete len:83 (+) Transcript_5706:2-250(+)